MGPRLIIFSTIKKLLQTPEDNSSPSVPVPLTSGARSSVNEAGSGAGPSTAGAGPSTSRACSSRVGLSTCTLSAMTSNQVQQFIPHLKQDKCET